ncbi:hypothetical protein QR680_010325 [Steinernema hermaphroditum]|uniref:EGF-like domain-containing protein n=1 Tax=Steinernema hermaphroditum TaxID=289476 RepID=A0AA39IR20_9BILA|nr:hypothetical protein QR680_010325 [Steinernema hermaphroditum]
MRYERQEYIRQLKRSPKSFDLAETMLQYVANLNVLPITENLYNFTSALVYVRERIQAIITTDSTNIDPICFNTARNIMLTEVQCLTTVAVSIVKEGTIFFKSILSFSSHFAKHGVKERMDPWSYWMKTLEIMKIGDLVSQDSAHQMYELDGWRVVVQLATSAGTNSVSAHEKQKGMDSALYVPEPMCRLRCAHGKCLLIPGLYEAPFCECSRFWRGVVCKEFNWFELVGVIATGLLLLLLVIGLVFGIVKVYRYGTGQEYQAIITTDSTNIDPICFNTARNIMLTEVQCLTTVAVSIVKEGTIFFKSILSFSSHFAKHGVKERMDPWSYWMKTLEIMKIGDLVSQDSAHQMYELDGWRVVVQLETAAGTNRYVKTTHRIRGLTETIV